MGDVAALFLVKIAQGIEPRACFPIQSNITIANPLALQPKETKGEPPNLRRTFFGWVDLVGKSLGTSNTLF